MKVANRKTIRRLAGKTFLANRTRNILAILAIALTALLFSAVFTIGVTMNNSAEQQTMRQVGGYSHGGFKRLTREQVEQLRKNDDGLIKESGATFLFATPMEAPFQKLWAEMRYAEDNYAKFCWSLPTTGTMPKSEKDIAMDVTVLEAMGITPELGKEVELTYPLGTETVTDTFTLCGYWEDDPALPAHMIWMSEDYVVSHMETVPEDVRELQGVGQWYLDIVFKDSRSIAENLEQIAEKNGYTVGAETKGTVLSTGVNWAYTSTHGEKMDAGSQAMLIGVILVILITGYLIIYNVFQISVAGDIRFYGLLKTIGTTARQIRRILWIQAWILSGIGIPLGLLLGYGVGNLMLPVIMANMSDTTIYRTVNPLIFVGAALFTLITVFISCFLPARHAAKVSPVEAVRYTEQKSTKKKSRKSRRSGKKGGRIFQMARANLFRNKLKTALVILSLTLSIVLLNGVYGFTRGFNMDSFLEKFVISDFLVADANYFKYSGWDSVSASLAENLESLDGFEDGGYVRYYNGYSSMEIPKKLWVKWMDYQQMPEKNRDPEIVGMADDDLAGLNIDLFGLDDYTILHAEVLEGSLEHWKDPDSIIQVVTADDYGEPLWEDALLETGTEMTLDIATDYDISENGVVTVLSEEKAVKKVIATVLIPGNMLTRSYGYPKWAMYMDFLPGQEKNDVIDMVYMADFTEEGTEAAEEFLANYTENVEPEMNYESKGKYVANYTQFQTMFWVVGGGLSLVIGLIGILNFVNGEITDMIARKRELAMLASIGMTGKQMKKMLISEGVFVVVCALLLAGILNLGVYFNMMPVIANLFWYFKPNFTMTMIFIMAPVFLLLGVGIPLLVYRMISGKSIVERLRETEA